MDVNLVPYIVITSKYTIQIRMITTIISLITAINSSSLIKELQ